jgi:hypothetical protein
MNATAAVFRARLGAALRALPSDLRRDGGGIHGRDRGVSKTDAGRKARGGIRSVAAALELASPGLALMMQLRARLFHDALRAAATRGFRRAVVIGAAFDRTRMRHLRRARLPVVIVDHPAVLAGAAPRRDASGIVRLALTDFADVAWDELRAQARVSHDGPTLFLVEGVSMWGDAATLRGWLRAVAGAAPASEVLLNVLESAIVDRAHQVTNADAQRFAGAAPAFGVGRALLLNEIIAAGLTPLRVFDSGEVQTAYLGIDDLLVRESYAWARVDAGRVDDTGALTVRDLIGAAPSRTPSARPLLPRLRSGVQLHEWHAGVRVVLPVTALRGCTRSFARRDSAVIRRFDGTRTVADLAAVVAHNGAADGDERLSRVVESLAAFGFLDDAAEPSSLGAASERAFTAFIGADRTVARDAARSLVPFAANPAAAHLHARLRHVGRLLVERDGSISVLAARTTASDAEARTVARTAAGFLRAIARLIGVRFAGRVLIDVASSRPGVPVTMIAAAEPHTLVHIPWPSYSPSLLSHELTHVLAMCASPWLSEGLAVWVQRLIAPGPCFPDDVSAQDIGAPSDHPLEHRLLGDERLAHDGGDGARRAYREAAAFVEWLVRRSGAVAFTRFFAAFGVHGDLDVDAACVAAGVPSLAALEREWRTS